MRQTTELQGRENYREWHHRYHTFLGRQRPLLGADEIWLVGFCKTMQMFSYDQMFCFIYPLESGSSRCLRKVLCRILSTQSTPWRWLLGNACLFPDYPRWSIFYITCQRWSLAWVNQAVWTRHPKRRGRVGKWSDWKPMKRSKPNLSWRELT